MNNDRIYLDHNASSPLRPQARAAMLEALDRHGNASSVHGEGRQARRRVEDAREQVAALVGASPADIVFTSGATEANNMVLQAGWDAILVAAIEHESILVPARNSGANVVDLGVTRDGTVDLGQMADNVLSGPHPGKAVLTLQMANNETGVCQEVAAAADFARSHDLATHTDAVQAAGRMAIKFDELGVDTLSLSSHKIGGPMGIGALVVRDGYRLNSFIQGGAQERRRRAGTENIAAIAGFGVAAECARNQLATEADRLRLLRDHAEVAMMEAAPQASFIGAKAQRLPNTICMALPGELAETTVIKLDLAGVAVSAGSACSSGKVGASHVLSAMGLPAEQARSAIRVSLGWNTTETSLETFLTRFHHLQNGRTRAVA